MFYMFFVLFFVINQIGLFYVVFDFFRYVFFKVYFNFVFFLSYISFFWPRFPFLLSCHSHPFLTRVPYTFTLVLGGQLNEFTNLFIWLSRKYLSNLDLFIFWSVLCFASSTFQVMSRPWKLDRFIDLQLNNYFTLLQHYFFRCEYYLHTYSISKEH